jgi:hypothetical protein
MLKMEINPTDADYVRWIKEYHELYPYESTDLTSHLNAFVNKRINEWIKEANKDFDKFYNKYYKNEK